MAFLHDAPIRRKIISMIMIISSLVLIASYGVITVNEWRAKHQLLADSLSTLARVVGINSSAALAFHDPENGVEILAALQSEPQVIEAHLYDQEGELFASYLKEEKEQETLLTRIIERLPFEPLFIQGLEKEHVHEVSFKTGSIEIIKLIQVDEKTVGTIHLHASLIHLYRTFFYQLVSMGVIVFAALFVALLLASRLQLMISRPILELLNIMSKVSKDQDYSLRAVPYGKDEIGDLINGFNQMLGQIQDHDAALADLLSETHDAKEDAEAAKVIAEKANHAKSEFLANMSHELRTPMHAVISFSSLGLKRLDTASTEKLAGYFSNIQGSGKRLLVLLDDLLDLSKLEAGKMQLDMKQNDLYQLVKRCTMEQESRIDEHRLTLDMVPPECVTVASFDDVRIGQVITNLLSNAIKFTLHDKTIRITISEESLVSENVPVPGLRFTMRDEGIGIPDDELEVVFDKFIQSSKTNTGAGGTGLGLAICKEIINCHGGRIWAENHPGGGAVFSFVLPVAIEEFDQPSDTSLEKQSGAEQFTESEAVEIG